MSLTVQVINQNESFSRMICRFLSSEGQKSVCSTFETYQKKAAENPPDLIIIDVAMPELTAVEVVSRLHRSSSTKHVPVIVISDFPDLEFELLHLFDFICKPVDLTRLREDIKILLAGKKKRPILKQQLSSEEHQKFHDFLILHSGLHFERRNMRVLERGLESRMSALRINSFSDYYQYLEQYMERRQELQKLLQFLTVGETFFFRYNAHFETLSKNILPSLISLSKGESVRIWSAGCSTGEEPYSIAMAIMETIPDWKSRDIKIIATDINSRSLKRAMDGVYSAWKLRVTPAGYIEKYFDHIGDSYVVKDKVRGLIDFSYLNLQARTAVNPPLFDIIFCRNVMIYFTTATTKILVDRFAEVLKPGGHLFLGHSETLSYISTRFDRHFLNGGFHYSKKREQEPKQDRQQIAEVTVQQFRPAKVREPSVAAREAVLSPPEIVDPETLFEQGIRLMHQERFIEAAELFCQTLQLQPGHTGAILATGQIHLVNNESEDALACFDRAIRINDLLPEAYFMRGFLFEIKERPDDALEEYRKAALLKMDFVMPHYQLGKLCFRKGDLKCSSRELRNSMKLLEKADRESLIPFSGGLSREVFLEQIRKEMEIVESAVGDSDALH